MRINQFYIWYNLSKRRKIYVIPLQKEKGKKKKRKINSLNITIKSVDITSAKNIMHHQKFKLRYMLFVHNLF